MIVSENKTPSPGFVSKWLDASKFGFWKSVLVVYCIFSLSCWAAFRFDPRLLLKLPFFGFLFMRGGPFIIFFMIGVLPGNLLTNLGILDNPHMLVDWIWVGGFWLVFIFLHIRVLFCRGKKKWLYLVLLLILLMLSMYNFFAYIPTSM